MKISLSCPTLVLLGALLFPASGHASPQAVQGYSVSVFAQGVNGKYSAPDSIAVLDDHVYIGYGDGNDPAGLDGKSNQIVEYDLKGNALYVYTVVGHNDGLKVDPYTHKLWAMQNEDANPNLVIIDPATHQQKLFTFAAPPPHGGGYDDITFRNGKVYFSASNPANNPNLAPAIVEAKVVGDTIDVTPALEANATATNVVTGTSVTLNLQDPDSMTLTPANDILLDSQADSELILLHRPGMSNQSVTLIPLSSPFGTPQADDTLFIPSDKGFVLVSDTPANIVYMIRKNAFVPGTAFTAAVGAPDANGNSVGFVGVLDMNFGDVTPIATGFQSPHGLGFVKKNGDEDDDRGSCQSTVHDSLQN
ncbi:MAG TPA: hypothetical protein VGG85_05450 [Terracidiphilus sp.]|jgi:hypothetical protein